MNISHRIPSAALLMSWILLMLTVPEYALAQTFSGPGNSGVNEAENINTGGSGDLRQTLTNLTLEVLSYVALAAVIVIIIAGILLITSIGNEEAVTRARKIILWTAAGLIVIVLAQAIVAFIGNAIAN